MPIKPIDFFNHLAQHGVEFFTGVPDSLLKEFCAYVTDHAGVPTQDLALVVPRRAAH